MKVVYVPFAPKPGIGFNFEATLDGSVYEMAVTWNIFGQRWYITATGADGAILFTLPVIGSPNEGAINMTAGYFTNSVLVYRGDTGNFEIWT